jgi:FkbM family methyltransferase
LNAPNNNPQPGIGDTVSIVRDGMEVVFSVVNERTAWRAHSLMSKEPGTVAWIEEFAPGEVLFDVGANVGMYSLCAARFRGVRVFAFEPESQNYAVLNQNIHRNRLHKQVIAFCIALSDSTRYDLLYLSEFLAGGSCHTFGESIGADGRPMAAAFRQGCFATTIDELVAHGAIAVPHHIKIDVDGNEPQVIRGASKTLADQHVKSVLIEINTAFEEHWTIIDSMLELGFDYSREEADRARRMDGPFAGVGNYVFRR